MTKINLFEVKFITFWPPSLPTRKFLNLNYFELPKFSINYYYLLFLLNFSIYWEILRKKCPKRFFPTTFYCITLQEIGNSFRETVLQYKWAVWIEKFYTKFLRNQLRWSEAVDFLNHGFWNDYKKNISDDDVRLNIIKKMY